MHRWSVGAVGWFCYYCCCWYRCCRCRCRCRRRHCKQRRERKRDMNRELATLYSFIAEQSALKCGTNPLTSSATVFNHILLWDCGGVRVCICHCEPIRMYSFWQPLHLHTSIRCESGEFLCCPLIERLHAFQTWNDENFISFLLWQSAWIANDLTERGNIQCGQWSQEICATCWMVDYFWIMAHMRFDLCKILFNEYPQMHAYLWRKQIVFAIKGFHFNWITKYSNFFSLFHTHTT